MKLDFFYNGNRESILYMKMSRKNETKFKLMKHYKV